MSTHQWNGRRSSRGAVWTTTLYGDVAEHRAQPRERRRGPRSAIGAHLAVGRVVESRRAVRRARRARRTAAVDAGGHHVTTSPSRTRHADAARFVDRVVHQIASRRREAIEHAVDERRHEVERDQLRVRMLDRRAGGLAVVDERRARARCPCARWNAARSRSTSEHLDARRRRRGRRSERSCAGDRTTTSCAPANAVADDRVLVRHDAHAPARRVGCARAGARDFGRCLALVAVAERARRARSAAAASTSARNVSGRGRTARRDDHARRRSARSSTELRTPSSGQATSVRRRIAWTSWLCVS